MTRKKYRSIATGGSVVADLLSQQADSASGESAEFDFEYRREVFHWAAEQVRGKVKSATWKAFWVTSVELRSASEVAENLGMTIGAVHIARSRVRGRSLLFRCPDR